MKRILLFFSTLLFCLPLTGNEWPEGYIVSQSDDILTGKITSINPTGADARVVFINDFGDEYPLHPSQIKGFVFLRDSSVFIYESKKQNDEWAFMQVLVKGSGVNLYKITESVVETEAGAMASRQASYFTYRYWLEETENQFIEISPLDYKRKLKKLFREKAPELANKVGDPGYQFADLIKMVTAYNEKFTHHMVAL